MERVGRVHIPSGADPRAGGGFGVGRYWQRRTRSLLADAGIEVEGRRPWDIRVHRDRFYRRALTADSVGIAESYMDGDWDCDQLDEFVARIVRADLSSRVGASPQGILAQITSAVFNRWSRLAVRRKVAPHYDLGNDLFVRMLDTDYMAYTCGYWREGVSTLEEAQAAKLDLVCRKLRLEPGMRVLDIGCGWGSFAKYAAEKHGVRVLGITLSAEQASLGSERCAQLPVELRVQDYRDVSGTFDRVVSIGCLEHIGHKNHRAFFKKIHNMLSPDG